MDSVSNWTPQQVVDWMKGEVKEYLNHLFTGERLAATDTTAEGWMGTGVSTHGCTTEQNQSIRIAHTLRLLHAKKWCSNRVNYFSIVKSKNILIPQH